jgi:hypothetical protein
MEVCGMSIAVMKQALEALEEAVEELGGKVCEKCEDAIEVLKATLNGLDELECPVCHRRAYPYSKCGCVTYVERGEA